MLADLAYSLLTCALLKVCIMCPARHNKTASAALPPHRGPKVEPLLHEVSPEHDSQAHRLPFLARLRVVGSTRANNAAHRTIRSIASRNSCRPLFRLYFSNSDRFARLRYFIRNHLAAIRLIKHSKVQSSTARSQNLCRLSLRVLVRRLASR
jgi:hypothetical protein